MDSPDLRPELASLLDAGRSEVKRWGGEGPNYLHLAAALMRRWPDEFEASFGIQDRTLIESALGSERPAGTEQDVIAVLQECNEADPVPRLVASLRSRLTELLFDPVETCTAPTTTPATTATSTPESRGGGTDASVAARGANEQTPPARASTAEAGWEPSVRIRRFVEVLGAEKIVGRAGVIDEIISLVARSHPRPALITGPRGVGRTNLGHGLARRLADAAYQGPLAGRPVVRVVAERVNGQDGARTFQRVLEDLRDEDVVVFVDDIDSLTGIAGQHPDIAMLVLLRSFAQSGSRLVMTCSTGSAGRIEVHDGSLWVSLTTVSLSDLSQPDLEQVLRHRAAAVASFHKVQLPDAVLTRAMAPVNSGTGQGHPGVALARLDNACVKARLRGETSVREEDLALTPNSMGRMLDRSQIQERLGLRVLGQTSSVDVVANRLALTTAGLDLRPERPDGVFLFVGSTGVGKTEMAKAISAEVFGAETPLIRLDMSEYAQEWALSRLTGPQPGYVGSTEPESWLTSRVIANPRSVVLLDEIEKAHPTIWNAFLQVFDAGRLSDSRGNTADFSEVVVVMTSNIGAKVFREGNLGFASDPANVGAAGEAKMLAAVKDTMPPELINRLDAVVVFRPLEPEAIRQIAIKELASVTDSLLARGYQLSVSPEAVDLIATSGYEPAYGARHLQRNIEKLLLQGLVDLSPGGFTASVESDAISWRPAH